MNLYHIQDGNRPMWVAAESFGEAVDDYKMLMAIEREMEVSEVDDPQSVTLICGGDDLLLPACIEVGAIVQRVANLDADTIDGVTLMKIAEQAREVIGVKS